MVPRSPRGPRPPPRPGESVYSGSSGQDGSCSASHRLTHTHKSVTVKEAKSSTIQKRPMVEPPSSSPELFLFQKLCLNLFNSKQRCAFAVRYGQQHTSSSISKKKKKFYLQKKKVAQFLKQIHTLVSGVFLDHTMHGTRLFF